MEVIKEKRKEKGLTLRQVADAIGVSESCMSLYESGKRRPSISTIVKLSKIFECSTDELLQINK